MPSESYIKSLGPIGPIVQFIRPYTLVPPALGMISGSLCALGAFPHFETSAPCDLLGWGKWMPWEWMRLTIAVGLGALMAAMLNAASNGLNQIFDIRADEINKPARPLPSERISLIAAWACTILFFLTALVLAAAVNLPCFLLASAATVCTVLYSAKPIKLKRFPFIANFVVALPRGVLLKVAGWSAIKSIYGWEPWTIGLIFGLFLFGTTSTKDFSDTAGDTIDGVETLPLRYGFKKTAWFVAPFFIFPFLLIPIFSRLGILTGNKSLLALLGVILAVWGSATAWRMLKTPEELSGENHPSWRSMYNMMMTLQIGFAIAYLI